MTKLPHERSYFLSLSSPSSCLFIHAGRGQGEGGGHALLLSLHEIKRRLLCGILVWLCERNTGICRSVSIATNGGTPLAKSARISASGRISDLGLVGNGRCSPHRGLSQAGRLHFRFFLTVNIGEAAQAGAIAIAACISTAAQAGAAVAACISTASAVAREIVSLSN